MYQANLEYPEIKVSGKDLNLAAELMYVYAGNVSELSSVNLYMYQSFISDITSELEGIAIVEMRHVEILAKLIVLLGGDPKFNSGDGLKWCSNNINYNKNVYEFLNYNIMIEKIAISNYKRIIDLSNDKYVKNILERIIMDEKVHIEVFERLLLKM